MTDGHYGRTDRWTEKWVIESRSMRLKRKIERNKEGKMERRKEGEQKRKKDKEMNERMKERRPDTRAKTGRRALFIHSYP